MKNNEQAFGPGHSRRKFLQLAVMAGGGLALRGMGAANNLDGPSKKILIMGAGLSGLVAGYELRRAGHQITILEATLRAGGRVRTLREPFSDGLYAEAGAGRIPKTHTLTLKYIKRFGLRVAPYRPHKGASVVYGGGHRVVSAPKQPVDLGQFGLGFTEEEIKLGLDGIYEKYIGSHSKQVGAVPPGEWPSAAVQALGNQTMRELMSAQGASEAAVRYLSSGYDDDSALDFLRDAYSHEAPELYHIIGGNDLLPRAFAEALSKEIIYGAPAMLVEQGDQGVRVTFERAGEKRTLAADHLICGVPFAALRQVQFRPALSAGKARAIAELPYGSVTRVYLQSRRRFWLDTGCHGFADILDLPMEIWNPSHDQPGQRGLQLAYMYEALARKVAAMPGNDRIAYFLDLMEKVFPGTHEHCEGGTSFSWEEQPYQRGAYAVFTKGAYAAYGPHIATAEGRIHFSGEHASPWPGWIQGALYSGLRAAQEAVQ